MTSFRVLAAVAMACAPIACTPVGVLAQTAYGTADLSRNTAVVDIPAVGPNGQTAAKAQGVVLLSPSTGGAVDGSVPGSIATAQATAGTTATQLVAARLGREEVVIENLGTTPIYLGPAGVTTSTGLLLPGVLGASVTLRTRAPVFGVVASGSQAVSTLELYR